MRCLRWVVGGSPEEAFRFRRACRTGAKIGSEQAVKERIWKRLTGWDRGDGGNCCCCLRRHAHEGAGVMAVSVRFSASGAGLGPRRCDGHAVGLGRFLGSPAIWILPVVFPLVMAFGGAIDRCCWYRTARSGTDIATSAVIPRCAMRWRLRAATDLGGGGDRQRVRDLPATRMAPGSRPPPIPFAYSPRLRHLPPGLPVRDRVRSAGLAGRS